jgi:hypothetical protein
MHAEDANVFLWEAGGIEAISAKHRSLLHSLRPAVDNEHTPNEPYLPSTSSLCIEGLPRSAVTLAISHYRAALQGYIQRNHGAGVHPGTGSGQWDRPWPI